MYCVGNIKSRLVDCTVPRYTKLLPHPCAKCATVNAPIGRCGMVTTYTHLSMYQDVPRPTDLNLHLKEYVYTSTLSMLSLNV